MLEEFAERIQNAKDKQFKMLERFHIGDTVYPFWLRNFIVYGTVIDIDTVARKVICDFNGIARQFCPEDLMLVNPAFVAGTKTASERKIDNRDYTHYVVLDDGSIESGWEYREDAMDRKKEMAEDGVKSKVLSRRALGDRPLDNANWHKGRVAKKSGSPDCEYSKFDETHLSCDTDNGIEAVCKECGGEIAVSYDEKTAVTDFVCTKCGKRIPESRLSKKSKKAMRRNQARRLAASSEASELGKAIGEVRDDFESFLSGDIHEIGAVKQNGDGFYFNGFMDEPMDLIVQMFADEDGIKVNGGVSFEGNGGFSDHTTNYAYPDEYDEFKNAMRKICDDANEQWYGKDGSSGRHASDDEAIVNALLEIARELAPDVLEDDGLCE